MRLRHLLAAGAAALSSTGLETSSIAQPAVPAAGWWYVGEAGRAPQRQVIFIDRSSVRARGGEARVRAMQVFEQPREGMKGLAVTYAFRCTARHFQTHDVVFTTTAGAEEPGVFDDWAPVAPNSVAALLLDAACFARFDSAARRIAGAPLAEAQGIFRNLDRAPPQVAAAAPRGGGLMPRDQLVQCLGASPPNTPACREARASAERGRAAAPGKPQGPARATAAPPRESYDQLLDRIVQADSQDWMFNRYEAGSMHIINVQRDARGNVSMLRGNYRYRSGPSGWVEAHFANGRLQCLQYHNRDVCIASTGDFYQGGAEAERDRHEYCQITRNC